MISNYIFLHKMQLILIYDPDLVDKIEHIVIMNKTCHVMNNLTLQYFIPSNYDNPKQND